MDVEGTPAREDYCDDSRHERGPAGLSSLEGRVDAATCCGQLYHRRISAALHSLSHVGRAEGALILLLGKLLFFVEVSGTILLLL